MARLRPAVRRRLTVAGRSATALLLACFGTLLFEVVAPSGARAESVPVPLGTAVDFAVLAGTTVTSAGTSTVTGDIGVSPGTAVTGFPPGQVNGSIETGPGRAGAAEADLATGYANASGRTPTRTIAGTLGGETLNTGVYESTDGTFGIAGTVTLDAQGDPGAVFIFKAVSTLITSAASTVNLAGGAQSCNVFWRVGSSATFGAGSTLRGNVLAFTSITVGANVLVDGRVMAINGAVTLDNDIVTRPFCAGPLSISAPDAAALGDGAPGGVVSGRFAPVTVTDERGISPASWTASVIASDFVTPSPVQTVSRTNVSYWSGPATASTGNGTFISGQPTADDAVIIDRVLTAFAHDGGTGVNSVTWRPTVSIRLPLSAVAGSYSGTLTFSVA